MQCVPKQSPTTFWRYCQCRRRRRRRRRPGVCALQSAPSLVRDLGCWNGCTHVSSAASMPDVYETHITMQGIECVCVCVISLTVVLTYRHIPCKSMRSNALHTA